MACDAIALFLDIDAAMLTVAVEPVLPDPAAQAVRAVGQTRAAAQAAAGNLAAAQVAAVRWLVETEHLTSRDVAAILSISHQRVSRLARAYHRRSA